MPGERPDAPLRNGERADSRHSATLGRRAGNSLSAQHGYRLKKYVRRNKGRVVAAGLVVLALAVGLGAVIAVQSAANARLAASLDRETRSNEELTRSRAAVQARYELALEAIKTSHTGESEEWLLKEERFKELRNRRLKSAADFYRRLSALLGKETDFGSRRALAQSNFELAEMTRKIGRPEDALAAHQAVLATREALAAEAASDPGILADIGRSLTEVASLLHTTGRNDEALKAYRRSESQLAEAAPSDPVARAALAACRSRMFILLFQQDNYAGALSALRLARADQEQVASASSASTGARRELAETVNGIGFMLWNMGKPAEAETEFRTALTIYTKLADENNTESEFKRGLGGCHFYIANVLWEQGKPSESETEYRLSIALIEKALKDNPAVTRLRRSLALCQCYLGRMLAHNGKLQAAMTELNASIANLKDLIEDNPGVGDFLGIMAEARSNLGVLLLQIGEPQRAETECRIAETIRQRLEKEKQVLAIEGVFHAFVLINLGDVVRSMGWSSEAKGLYEQGIRLSEPLAKKNSNSAFSCLALVSSKWRRGQAHRRSG